MTKLEGLLHQLAQEIRVCANCADDKWARSVTVIQSFLASESREKAPICSFPTRVKVPGELVRVDLNPLNHLASKSTLSAILVKELEPFIIGVGQIQCDETPEGFVVLAGNFRSDDVTAHEKRVLPDVAITG